MLFKICWGASSRCCSVLMKGIILCPWPDSQNEDNETCQICKNLWGFFFLINSCFLSPDKTVLGARVIGEGVEAWWEVSSESLMHHCQACLYLDCLKSNSCCCHKISRHCHTKEDTKNGRTLTFLHCSEMLSSPGFMPAISYFSSFHPHCQ